MADPNPHRGKARAVAYACYILAGIVLVFGTALTLMALTVEISGPRLEGVTNGRMAIMLASTFGIIALLIALFGWRVRDLFGQDRRQEKLGAKSAVGCLRLGSLGCGLWALPSAFAVLITGKWLPTGDPAGWRDVFIGSSGHLLAIALMLSAAWFVSVNFVRANLAEARRAYREYLERVQPRLSGLTELATRAYVQEQTADVLTKLDATHKALLLEYLSHEGLLTGATRLALQGADFRGVDLHAINLPHADLRGVNLEHAKLQGAMLFEADLSRAKLNRADLSRANLQGANLRHADLTGAQLDGANLRGADLTAAVVSPSQLGRARLEQPFNA